MTRTDIKMVDLKGQYERIKEEIDAAITKTLDSTRFIGGHQVDTFKENLEKYLDIPHVIPCANGTDALQIAMMALNLRPGDEIIVPAFTYAATAEVVALLDLTPVMVDVDPSTFNIDIQSLETAITDNTRAIVPVHLYGQSAQMEEVKRIAEDHNIFIIEDTAQAIGAEYIFEDGRRCAAGSIGHFGTISFFPSKNLGCYGDGGCLITHDEKLAAKAKMIANHGQTKKYYHKIIGMNSRLDAIQAGILNVKLRHLDDFALRRVTTADAYDEALNSLPGVITPSRSKYSTHVFHQYTIRVLDGKRDELKTYLQEQGIPTTIYYPLPLYDQEAFSKYYLGEPMTNTEALCKEVLSLPIHTEMKSDQQEYIIHHIKAFFDK